MERSETEPSPPEDVFRKTAYFMPVSESSTPVPVPTNPRVRPPLGYLPSLLISYRPLKLARISRNAFPKDFFSASYDSARRIPRKFPDSPSQKMESSFVVSKCNGRVFARDLPTEPPKTKFSDYFNLQQHGKLDWIPAEKLASPSLSVLSRLDNKPAEGAIVDKIRAKLVPRKKVLLSSKSTSHISSPHSEEAKQTKQDQKGSGSPCLPAINKRTPLSGVKLVRSPRRTETKASSAGCNSTEKTPRSKFGLRKGKIEGFSAAYDAGEEQTAGVGKPTLFLRIKLKGETGEKTDAEVTEIKGDSGEDAQD